MELWKDIKGYEGHYQISNSGEVKSLKKNRQKILSNRVNAFGYHHVSLLKDGKTKEKLVHRLVAEHFLNETEKETVNHIDCNKINNHVDNLEWATRSEQMIHAYHHKLKKPVHNGILTDEEVREIRSIYKARTKDLGMRALARKYNVSDSTIFKLISNRSYKDV